MIVASCSGTNKSGDGEGAGNALSGNVLIDGSSTVYPLSEAVAEEFRAVAPEVRVTIGSSGTGAGFKKFARNETDISDASRAIKDIEKKTLKDAGIDYTEITVAYDGLAVFTNKANDWISSITVDQLKMIWEPAAEGKITRWNQINSNWPDEEIHLYGPSTAHGTYDYFTEEIVGESGASRGDYTAAADYNALIQGVSTDKYALGYVALAYVTENADKLNLLGVDNGNGPVIPNDVTVANGTYSPLSRPLFIYVKNSSLAKPEVKTFVDYYLKNAAKLSEDVGYIALPQKMYTDQLARFDSKS